MSAWLLSIVGVTVIGVLVELLLTDSPMSRFVRSIYAFFILFVIVQPLPNLLNNASFEFENNIEMNTGLYNNIVERRVREALQSAGYNNVLVTFNDGKFVIDARQSTKNNPAEIINIVTAIGGVRPDAVEVIT